MFVLDKNGLNFNEAQLPDFVASATQHAYGKKILFNDTIASGHYKLLEFSNGFHAYVSNYIMNDDFQLELAVDSDEYFALHINQIQAGIEFSMLLNGKAVSYDDKIITSLFLTGSGDSFMLNGSKGACINRLKIVIPKEWVLDNIPGFNQLTMEVYLSMQEDRFVFDAMNDTYRDMVDKIMNTEDNGYYLPATQNTVVSVTEYFFDRLNNKLAQKNNEDERAGKVA